jgi:hypothetical protein
MVESASPDGRYAVLSTARWNALSRYDLALLDLATGAQRQLTSGDETDVQAHWSHDGTQIAFLRRSFTSLLSRVCHVGFDGSGLECSPAASDVQRVIGWVDDTKLLIIRGSDAVAQLAIIDLSSGELTTLRPDLMARNGSLAPNGQFVACLCTRRGTVDWRWHIFPLGRDFDARVLEGSAQESIAIRWRAARAPAGLQHLTIDSANTRLEIDVPHQFAASGTMRGGQQTHPRWLRWSSSDPDVVDIGSVSGLALPRRDGTATIAVDAGGRVSGERTVRVTSRLAASATTENWTLPLPQNWVVIGTPTPYVDTIGARVVLRPNGDGSYLSAVVSRHVVPVSDGAALDAEVSLRLTKPQWQSVGIGFEDMNPFAWSANELEQGRPNSLSACVVTFPAGENRVWADSVRITALPEQVRVGSPAGAHEGIWWRLRVQLLPDGRCGVALNGVPVFISGGSVGLGANARIHVSGNSHQTDALVGRLTLWRGVPNDIDWAAFERQRRQQSSDRVRNTHDLSR